MATTTLTLTDLHPDIIQTHILSRLDGPSLAATATTSSHLKTICSTETLWSQICKTTWPSITLHPNINHIISTFPARHQSFFRDSFPTLLSLGTRRDNRKFSASHSKQPHLLSSTCHSRQSELISAVDIRYQDEVIYSAIEFTPTSFDFLSSPFHILLNNAGSKQVPRISKPIDLEVDEIAGADHVTLSQVKESLTLSWIIIDPTRKRACNLSSIKPVSARQDWNSNESIVRFVTVLPGSEPGEMVQCKIHLVLGVCMGGVGLHVKEVRMELVDLNCRCLDGREFLVILAGVILEESGVKRKVMDDEERLRIWEEFKEMKREKKEWERVEEEKREFAVKMNYVLVWVSFCFSIYFLILLLN